MESSSKCSGLNSLLKTAQRITEENTQQKDDSTILESGLGKKLQKIFFQEKKVEIYILI